MSAIVPAPTACTLAAAPPARIRIVMSIAMLRDSAHSMLNTRNKENDEIYMVRRPSVSENDDHHRGNMDVESI